MWTWTRYLALAMERSERPADHCMHVVAWYWIKPA
jgi:hypothetical protein